MLTTKAEAIAGLRKRQVNRPEPIDNAALVAGSPMYFYCIVCGALADVKPEEYIIPPAKLCKECQDMKDAGWLE